MAFDKLIEEKLRQAREEGQFDPLPRKGRLEFEDDVFHFNLRAPALSLHRFPLRIAEEYKALGID